MSDHRAHVKIEFSIYGQTFEWDTSINYFPDAVTGIDSRVVDFFVENYAEARAAWDTANAAGDALLKRTGVESRERAELARLKAKYEVDVTAVPFAAIPLPTQGDATAWTAVKDSFERTDGPLFTDAYDRMGEGGMAARKANSMRWMNPTPAGELSAIGINCRVCGHIVSMKPGDAIWHGDPRLCEHLGGPASQ